MKVDLIFAVFWVIVLWSQYATAAPAGSLEKGTALLNRHYRHNLQL
ncbi:MAG: hypothetical protein LBE56_05675 [Tannerella sp.]|nr:hypothetical protein [Tannerella sp.]